MATQINNTANATYSYGRSAVSSATSNVATTNLIQEYAISGYKTSLNTAYRPGDNITYQIVIRNDGTAALYNVKAVDDLGGGTNPLTYVAGSATLNLNGTNTDITPTEVGDNLTFTLPQSLQGGDQATITYVAQVSPMVSPMEGEVTNTVTITANEGSEGGQAISVTPNPSVTLLPQDFAEIIMNKIVSANEIVPGQQFSYTITLENLGNLDATNVTLTDVLPENFTITSLTALTGGVQTTYNVGDYTLEPGTNKLTVPTGSGAAITVPAAVGSVSGKTTVTITGSIAE